MEREQLIRLISDWCDGAIAAPDLARLQDELKQNAEARQDFLAYMDVHAGVQAHVVAQETINSLLTIDDGFRDCQRAADLMTPTAQAGARRRARHLVAAIATAAAIVVVSWQLWPARVNDRRQGDLSGLDRGAARESIKLADVISATADCRWFIEAPGEKSGDSVRTGDSVRVSSGSMKLGYESGTVVTLHSPGLYEVLSPMETRILLGKLTAKVAKGGEGFSVITPRATVVDLGTEFGVEVNDVGATDVVVFDGAVDVDYKPELAGGGRQQRLNLGEAVTLDAFGTASRLVSITNQRFSDHPLGVQGRKLPPPVIKSVHDNIQRNESWNYYEIVQAGMGEDALAFVDRKAHQWNGVTTHGMPAYLIGGDYVKTFNNDRVAHDIEIVVTLARPAHLYVLFDDRIPAPTWLEQEFTRTGDKIGIEVGPFFSSGQWHRRDHVPAVGAGIGVVDTLSVWRRDIDAAGPVRLGATESSETGLNMYGIVAVPMTLAP
jgi:hypothetical protein